MENVDWIFSWDIGLQASDWNINKNDLKWAYNDEFFCWKEVYLSVYIAHIAADWKTIRWKYCYEDQVKI